MLAPGFAPAAATATPLAAVPAAAVPGAVAASAPAATPANAPAPNALRVIAAAAEAGNGCDTTVVCRADAGTAVVAGPARTAAGVEASMLAKVPHPIGATGAAGAAATVTSASASSLSLSGAGCTAGALTRLASSMALRARLSSESIARRRISPANSSVANANAAGLISR